MSGKSEILASCALLYSDGTALVLLPKILLVETDIEARAGVGKWFEFYNRKRTHAALGGRSRTWSIR